jgi:hypothetical protein
MFQVKSRLGIHAAVLIAQTQSAPWNFPDAAPGAMGDLKYFSDPRLRLPVAFLLHGASLLVLCGRPAAFELGDQHQHAFEEIKGLEACDDNRHVISLTDRKVFFVPGDHAGVAGRKEGLDPALRRCKDCLHRGRH